MPDPTNMSGLPSPDAEHLYVTANRLAISGAFVSGLAHELNNPLQVVNGTVELLLARQDLPQDVVTKLERVANQVARASGTILEVLGFVRDRTTTPVRADIRTIIEQAAGLRRYPLNRAAITLVLDLPAPGAAFVQVKPVDVAQVLLNLVMNAEAALAGQKGGQIGIAARADGGSVRVRVSDNGPGIAPELRARIFEPFVTRHGLDTAAGLGLPASVVLASRYGGRLWLDEDAAQTTFVLELPTRE